MVVGAALSGSVLVFSVWPPLSSVQRGVAVIIVGVILALHFLLAAGLQLYFFRYSKEVVAAGTGHGTFSPGHPVAVEQQLGGGVTPLQSINLVLENEPPAIIKALETPSSSAVPSGSNQAQHSKNSSKSLPSVDDQTRPKLKDSASQSHHVEDAPVSIKKEDETNDATPKDATEVPPSDAPKQVKEIPSTKRKADKKSSQDQT